MKLHFEKLSRFARNMEYASVAVPFAKGRVFDVSGFFVRDIIRRDIRFPTQCAVTAKWDDGSVKWALVKMLVDLPANKSADFLLDTNTGSVSITDMDKNDFPEIAISANTEGLAVNNGCMSIRLTNASTHILDEVLIKVKTSVIDKGFTLYDENGNTAQCVMGDWEINEDGPIEAVFSVNGKLRLRDAELDMFIVLRVLAGKPYMYFEHKIMNLSDADSIYIDGLELKFSLDDNERADRKAIGISNYGTKIIEGEAPHMLIDADMVLHTANEHMPETIFGTFWADICGEKSGLGVTLYQAHQNFPKELRVIDNEIIIGIIPRGTGYGLSRGMAKTHRLMLHFHDKNTSLDEINIRSLQFQMPDIPNLTPDAYKCGVFDDVFPMVRDVSAERSLVYAADSRGRAYGMTHWGDAYDENYTKQGRGGGKLIWLNNEYDFPHAAMLMYAITGERRFMDYAIAGVRHWIDIDICHLSNDPLRQGAQIMHSPGHVCGEVEISHEWIEGILDYYHQTGDKFAYEAAMGIGENIIRHLEHPRYKKAGEITARETGWAMRALIALFKETNDNRYLSQADMIFGHFKKWQQAFGAFLAPYTDHTVIRVPFMISIAVGSLYRYYTVRPLDEVKKMIIEAVDDMIENCLTESGWFYYKELPSLRRIGSNALVLEALADAYSLTGDNRYLDVGLKEFDHLVAGNITRNANNKRIDGDAVIQEGVSPKNFAQSFYPIMRFCVEKGKI